MILAFCVSGSTAAVHTGDSGSSPRVQVTLEAIFLFNSFLMCISYTVKVANTKLWDINWLMDYRDAQWYIKNTRVGFSVRKITKQAVGFYSFLDDGLPEMVKLLPVAHECFRKWNF